MKIHPLSRFRRSLTSPWSGPPPFSFVSPGHYGFEKCIRRYPRVRTHAQKIRTRCVVFLFFSVPRAGTGFFSFFFSVSFHLSYYYKIFFRKDIVCSRTYNIINDVFRLDRKNWFAPWTRAGHGVLTFLTTRALTTRTTRNLGSARRTKNK